MGVGISGAVVISGEVAAGASVPNPPLAYDAITNRDIYLPPPLVGALDLSGGREAGRGTNYRFQDPTFSTYIIRVTDNLTNPDVGYHNRSYSTTNSAENSDWNTDSTMFFVAGQGGEYMPFTFDKSAHTIARMGSPLTASGGLWTIGIIDQEPSWSYRDPMILWGGLGFEIRKLDFTTVNSSSTTIPYTVLSISPTSIYTTLLGSVPTGSKSGITVSSGANSEWVGFAYGGGGVQDTWRAAILVNTSSLAYYFIDTRYGTTGNTRVYSSATATWTVTGTAGQWGIHNVKVSRNGRYVTLTAVPAPTAGQWDQVVWDTTGASVTTITANSTNATGGHKVNGYSYVLNDTSEFPPTQNPVTIRRPFGSLTTVVELMNPRLITSSSYADDSHPSWNNVREDEIQPVINMFIRVVPVDVTYAWRPWDDELDAISTNPSSPNVWRFLHHHAVAYDRLGCSGGSMGGDFLFTPNVSQDGRYALFTTNWECTLGIPPQYHVFLAELPLNS